MKKSGNNKVIRAGVGYTAANVLIKGLSFLTLPLFSRIMTTEQFGVYNVFVSYESMLSLVVGFAIHSSLKSANLRFKDEINEYTSSVSLIYILSGCIWLLLSLVFNRSLSEWMEMKGIVVPLMVLYSFGSAVILLYNNRISLEYAYKRYLGIALLNAVGNIALSLILMFTIFSKERDVGRIVGVSVSIFCLSAALVLSMFRKAKPRYNKAYWRFAMAFSLPMVPHGISQVLLGQFDRIMIQKICGNSDAGIFSLASNIKMIAVVLIDSLTTTWGVWFFEKMAADGKREVQRRAAQLCGLFCVLSIGLMAISPELILILGGEEYKAGQYVAIPMIVDAFILFVYSVIVQSEYYKNKTIFVMMGTMIAAVIDIVLNLIFIPRYGFVAAAYTTLAAYICYLILHCLISRRLVGFWVVPLKWLFAFAGIITAFALWNRFFIDTLWIRWLTGMIAAVVIGWFFAKEYIKGLLRR